MHGIDHMKEMMFYQILGQVKLETKQLSREWLAIERSCVDRKDTVVVYRDFDSRDIGQIEAVLDVLVLVDVDKTGFKILNGMHFSPAITFEFGVLALFILFERKIIL